MVKSVELNTVKACKDFECCYLVPIMIIQEWSIVFFLNEYISISLCYIYTEKPQTIPFIRGMSAA